MTQVSPSSLPSYSYILYIVNFDTPPHELPIGIGTSSYLALQKLLAVFYAFLSLAAALECITYLFVYPENISPSNWLIAFSSINILRGAYEGSVNYMWFLYVLVTILYFFTTLYQYILRNTRNLSCCSSSWSLAVAKNNRFSKKPFRSFLHYYWWF